MALKYTIGVTNALSEYIPSVQRITGQRGINCDLLFTNENDYFTVKFDICSLSQPKSFDLVLIYIETKDIGSPHMKTIADNINNAKSYAVIDLKGRGYGQPILHLRRDGLFFIDTHTGIGLLDPVYYFLKTKGHQNVRVVHDVDVGINSKTIQSTSKWLSSIIKL